MENPKELTTVEEYVYLGDKNTDLSLKGKSCFAVRRADGKCIRGRNGSMLVSFGETKMVVVGRMLRKSPNAKTQISKPKRGRR
jgi:hypothetical protein